MSWRCRAYRRLLGLDVGGDLPQNKTPGLEAHLAGCEDCRAFRAGLVESRQQAIEAFQQIAGSERCLARIRPGVAERISGLPPQQQPRHAVGARALSGGLAACLVVVAGLWLMAREGGYTREPNEAETKLGVIVASPTESQAAIPADIQQYGPQQSKVLKIYTRDPNVVIYWLMDEKETNHVNSSA